MDATIKAEWIQALRSGDYKQGRNKLQWDGNFCCLGVLCELSPVVEAAYNPILEAVTYTSLIEAEDRDENYPPAAAWIWAGWMDKNPFVETGPGQFPDGSASSGGSPFMRGAGHYLSNLNDAGFTFDQIADVIEYFL